MLSEARTLNPRETKHYEKACEKQLDGFELQDSLKKLTEYLFKYSNRKVFILIDEYDTPIHSSYRHHCYGEVVKYMAGFLGAALKDNKYLGLGILTGILQVAQAGMFSDMNNTTIYTMLSDNNFNECFGFTEKEVKEVLQDIALPGQLVLEEILQRLSYRYGGYQIGNALLYNPWSLMNVIDQLQKHIDLSQALESGNYWIDTGSMTSVGAGVAENSHFIENLLEKPDKVIQEDFKKLLLEKTIEKRINKRLVLSEFSSDSNLELIWSLLFLSGYLTRDVQHPAKNTGYVVLTIPNAEIFEFFKEKAIHWFCHEDVLSQATFVSQLQLVQSAALKERYFKYPESGGLDIADKLWRLTTPADQVAAIEIWLKLLSSADLSTRQQAKQRLQDYNKFIASIVKTTYVNNLNHADPLIRIEALEALLGVESNLTTDTELLAEILRTCQSLEKASPDLITRLTVIISQLPPSLQKTLHQNRQQLEKNQLHITQQAYLNRIIAENNYLEIRGVSLQRKIQVPLEKLYIALKLDNRDSYERQRLLDWHQQFFVLQFSSGEFLPQDLKVRLQAWCSKQPDQIGKTFFLTQALFERILASEEFTDSEIKQFKQTHQQHFEQFYHIHQLYQGGNVEDTKPQTIAEVYEQSRHLMILGHPGSGKTTLARWLTLKMAQALLKGYDRLALKPTEIDPGRTEETPLYVGKQVRLPILIRGTDYYRYYLDNKKNHTLSSFITEIGATSDAEKQLLLAALVQGNALIIIDGLDEITDKHAREALADDIQQFIGKSSIPHPDDKGNRVMITSRIIGEYVSGFDAQLQRFTVEGMTTRAIQQFYQEWFKAVTDSLPPSSLGGADAQRLVQQLKQKPLLWDMSRIPQLANLIATLYHNLGRVSQTRAQLYQKSIAHLIETWTDQKKINLKNEQIFRLLTLIADEMHHHTSSITERELQRLLHQSLQPEQTESFLELLRHDVGLLVAFRQTNSKEYVYRFLHRTFQEYLAGYYLIKDYLAGQEPPQILAVSMIERLTNPLWREPLLLAIGILSLEDSERLHALIQALLDHCEQALEIFQAELSHETQTQFLLTTLPTELTFIVFFIAEMLVEINYTEDSYSEIFKSVETIVLRLLVVYDLSMGQPVAVQLHPQIEAKLLLLYQDERYQYMVKKILKKLILSTDTRDNLVPTIAYFLRQTRLFFPKLLQSLQQVFDHDEVTGQLIPKPFKRAQDLIEIRYLTPVKQAADLLLQSFKSEDVNRKVDFTQQASAPQQIYLFNWLERRRALTRLNQTFFQQAVTLADYQKRLKQEILFPLFKEISYLLGPAPCAYEWLILAPWAMQAAFPGSELRFVLLIAYDDYRNHPYFQAYEQLLQYTTSLLSTYFYDEASNQWLATGFTFDNAFVLYQEQEMSEKRSQKQATMLVNSPSSLAKTVINALTNPNTQNREQFLALLTYASLFVGQPELKINLSEMYQTELQALVMHSLQNPSEKKIPLAVSMLRVPVHHNSLSLSNPNPFHLRVFNPETKEPYPDKKELDLKKDFMQPFTSWCLDVGNQSFWQGKRATLLHTVPEILKALVTEQKIHPGFCKELLGTWEWLLTIKAKILQVCPGAEAPFFLAPPSNEEQNKLLPGQAPWVADEGTRQRLYRLQILLNLLYAYTWPWLQNTPTIILDPILIGYHELTIQAQLAKLNTQIKRIKLKETSIPETLTSSYKLEEVGINIPVLIPLVIETLYLRNASAKDYREAYRQLPEEYRPAFIKHISTHPTLATMPQLLSRLKRIPDHDGSRIACLEECLQWEQHLLTLTEPYEEKIAYRNSQPQRVILEWIDQKGQIQKRLLPLIFEQQLFQTNGELNLVVKENDGRRWVVALREKESIVAYVKLPELPGIQAAAERLMQRISGISSYSTLVRCFHPKQELAYPLLFSQPAGETLLQYRRTGSLSQLESHLNPYFFTLKVIETLLISPGDDKDSNLAVVSCDPSLSEDIAISNFALVSFDADQGFGEAMVENKILHKEKIQQKTLLYCFDAMKQPLDEEAIIDFTYLDIPAVLSTWLKELKQLNLGLIGDKKSGIFSSAEIEAWTTIKAEAQFCFIPLVFAPGTLVKLFEVSHRLQATLTTSLSKRKESVLKNIPTDPLIIQPVSLLADTPMGLVRFIEPRLAVHYETAFTQGKTPEERFAKLPTDYILTPDIKSPLTVQQSVTQSKARVLQSITLVDEDRRRDLRSAIQNRSFCDPVFVDKHELAPLINLLYRIDDIRRALYQGNIKPLIALDKELFGIAPNMVKTIMVDYLKEQLLEKLDWCQLTPPAHQSLLEYQKEILTLFITTSFRYLVIRHCPVLDDATLKKWVENSPNLLAVRLLDCGIITNSGIESLLFLPYLQSIRLEKLNLLTFLKTERGLFNLFTPVWPQLRQLVIQGCQQLQHLALTEVPQLQGLQIKDCAALKEVRLPSNRLSELGLSQCPQLSTESISILLQSQHAFKRLGIKACPHLEKNYLRHRMAQDAQWHAINFQSLIEADCLDLGDVAIPDELMVQIVQQCPDLSALKLSRSFSSPLPLTNLLTHASRITHLTFTDYTAKPTSTTLLRGNSSVSALAVLPNGWLASGFNDNTIQLWDVATQHLVAILHGHSASVWALAVLPNGWLASCSRDKTIQIWDVITQQGVVTLRGHADLVSALAVLRNGWLASGSYDHTIKLWDVTTKSYIGTLEGHSHRVTTLAVLPNDWLASGSYDHTIKLWDVTTKSYIGTLEGHSHWVTTLAVLPNDWLASGSYDHTIKLWDITTRHCVATLSGHSASVDALAVLPDGWLASGSWDKTIMLWDVTLQRRRVRILRGHSASIWTLAVLPNGLLASGCNDKTIQLWKFPSKQLDLTDRTLLAKSLMISRQNQSLILEWRGEGSLFKTITDVCEGLLRCCGLLHQSFQLNVDEKNRQVILCATRYGTPGQLDSCQTLIEAWCLKTPAASSTLVVKHEATPASSLRSINQCSEEESITALSNLGSNVLQKTSAKTSHTEQVAAKDNIKQLGKQFEKMFRPVSPETTPSQQLAMPPHSGTGKKSGETLPNNFSEIIQTFSQAFDQCSKSKKKTVTKPQNSRQMLEAIVNRLGFQLENVPGDGNCFFHAVLHQLQHSAVASQYQSYTVLKLKTQAIEYLLAHQPEFRDFIPENFNHFIASLKGGKKWAEDVSITALANALNIEIVIINSDGSAPILKKQPRPLVKIYLGYEVEYHYQSLVLDPTMVPQQSLDAYLNQFEVPAARLPINQKRI